MAWPAGTEFEPEIVDGYATIAEPEEFETKAWLNTLARLAGVDFVDEIAWYDFVDGAPPDVIGRTMQERLRKKLDDKTLLNESDLTCLWRLYVRERVLQEAEDLLDIDEFRAEIEKHGYYDEHSLGVIAALFAIAKHRAGGYNGPKPAVFLAEYLKQRFYFIHLEGPDFYKAAALAAQLACAGSGF
jgi:hypothetical protein